jgi:hypothetical protein
MKIKIDDNQTNFGKYDKSDDFVKFFVHLQSNISFIPIKNIFTQFLVIYSLIYSVASNYAHTNKCLIFLFTCTFKMFW